MAPWNQINSTIHGLVQSIMYINIITRGDIGVTSHYEIDQSILRYMKKMLGGEAKHNPTYTSIQINYFISINESYIGSN
jgi:hypothetical protein